MTTTAIGVRRIARVCAALAFSALVAWQGPSFAQTKVIIGTAKDPNLGAQLIIARDKGYFREAGLDAELKFFPTGGDLMAAFVGGSVQLGSSGATPTTTLRSRPFPVKIVSQISDISGAQHLIVKQSVQSLEQLQGKKIGILRGTASEALFNSIVKGYGLDASKVELVNMGPSEMLQGFVQGTVDAVCLWEPFSIRARKAGGGKVLVSGTQSHIPGKQGPKRVYGDHAVLFTTDAFIRDHPNTVRAVLTALIKATEFIEKNKQESIAILAAEFGLETADMTDVMAANRYALVLDDELVADLNKLSDFLYGLKRTTSPVKAIDWIDPAPLRAVRPALVKLQ